MRPAAKRKRPLTRRLTAVLTGVAGLALLYVLLTGRDQSDVELGDAAEQRGYFMSDATLTEMGPDGKPRIVVRAGTIEQQLADQSVDLSSLNLDYRTKDFGVWHVTTLSGHMPANRQSILSNRVISSAQTAFRAQAAGINTRSDRRIRAAASNGRSDGADN